MAERAPLPDGGPHLVAVANFFGPTSGGIKTALMAIGREYQARGARSSIIAPGPHDGMDVTESGTLYTVAAPLVPGSGGYRVITRTQAVRTLIRRLDPDRLDRTTLHGLGRWARSQGLPALFIAHERLDGVLAAAGVPAPAARSLADIRNRATAAAIPRLVATTDFAATEFRRIGATVHRIPLGVDIEAFTPTDRTANPRVELVLCSRLTRQKRPDLAIATLAELTRRGVDARLTIIGSGPERERLQAHAEDLPVRFLGYIADRDHLRTILGASDIALTPGPLETFGLAALEALACGTPVVANSASALPEVVGSAAMAGRAAAGIATGFADAVQSLLAIPRGLRSAAARRRAEMYPWSRTADAPARAAYTRRHQRGSIQNRRRYPRVTRQECAVMTTLSPAPSARPERSAPLVCALGDSVSSGVGDRVAGTARNSLRDAPDGGWPAHLATTFGASLLNFGRNGARARDVVGTQLAQARAAHPDLATVFAGGNDVLRGDFDIDEVRLALSETVATLLDGGAEVVLVVPPQIGPELPVPAVVRDVLIRRMHQVRCAVEHIGEMQADNKLILVDSDPVLAHGRRVLHIDRIHPSPLGHRLLAEHVGAALQVRGWQPCAVVSPPPPPSSAAMQAVWLLLRGGPWLVKRSRDLLPELARVVIVEQVTRRQVPRRRVR